MLVEYITFCQIELDIKCHFTEDVPKETEKISDVGNGYDQFQDLDGEADINHHSDFILISLLVFSQNRIKFYNVLQMSLHNHFNLSHYHLDIKEF